MCGSPAEVETKLTPCSTTKSTMSGSRTKASATLTPKGLSVSWRIKAISLRIASSSPDEVSMMPIAPALDTADASCERAIQPMGACIMGVSTPSILVTRLSNFILPVVPCQSSLLTVPRSPLTAPRWCLLRSRRSRLARDGELARRGRGADSAASSSSRKRSRAATWLRYW